LFEMSGETLAAVLHGAAWCLLAFGVVMFVGKPFAMSLPGFLMSVGWSLVLFGVAVFVRLAVRVVTAIEKIAERVGNLSGQTEQG